MGLLADPVKWKQWMPGADSAILVMMQGKAGGIMSADGKQLIITQITDSSVLAENTGHHFRRGETGWKLLGGDDDSTTVTVQWYMDFYLRWYPWEKFGSLIFERSYGARMETGLSNLKKIAAGRIHENSTRLK